MAILSAVGSSGAGTVVVGAAVVVGVPGAAVVVGAAAVVVVSSVLDEHAATTRVKAASRTTHVVVRFFVPILDPPALVDPCSISSGLILSVKDARVPNYSAERNAVPL